MSGITKEVAVTASSLAMVALALAPMQSMAMVVTHDEATFMAMFINPTEVIDFTHLVDGRTFANADFSAYVAQTRQPPLSYLVRQDGWSSHLNIGSTTPGCQCAWQAVSWSAPGVIAPDYYASMYVELLGALSPIALGSGGDFTGLIPENETDRFYILSQADNISSVRLGFTPVADQPSFIAEPATFALVLAALASSLVTVRRNGHAAAARLAAAATHQPRLTDSSGGP